MLSFGRKLMAACVVAAVAAAGAALPSRAQEARMPRLEFRDRTLANGLRVLTAADRSSPTVSIQVWYKVGSKDDPEGRSGFAHLFEHLMFKATKNMRSEMMDRLTEDVGGVNNASTGDDVTIYWEVVPSNYTETLLWAEAERMGSLIVDDPAFKSERDVVKEEYRERVLSSPYGRLFYLLMSTKSFAAHPYRRPGIGSIEDLNAATLEDVRKFHTDFYRPDNATLVVVGDFDEKQLDSWIDKYFGSVARPARPLPRVTAKEPARTGELRAVEYAPGVPLPAVAFTFLAPPQSDDDTAALQVAEVILSGGESSRLYRSLVYEQQVAQVAQAGTDLREDVSLFNFITILASGKKPEDAERAMLAEIKKIQDAPPAAGELEKAKNQLVTGQLQERETNQGKAEALAEAAVLLGDPNRVNTQLERLAKVSAADVQRVMKKYLTDANRLVIYYLPEEMRGRPAPGGGAQGAAEKRQPARR